MRLNRYLWLVILLALCVLPACVRNEESHYYLQADSWTAALASATDIAKISTQGPPSDATWAPLSLPHIIRLSPHSSSGSIKREWVTYWHRIRVPVAIDKRNLAVYIPRVRWPRGEGRLDVFIGKESLDTSEVVWNSPVLLNIPDRFINKNASDVDIFVALSLVQGQSGGISRIAFGSMGELRVRYAWREFFQQRIPQITSISFAILGVFAFVFWLKRRGEIAYLLFAAIAAVNLVRNLHYYFINPEDFGDGFWWLMINALGWLLVLAHLFAVHLHGQRFPKMERALIGAIVLVTCASLTAVIVGVTIERWGPATYLVQMIAGLAIPTLSTIGVWRSRSMMAILLTLALWLNVLLGVHDFLLQNWRISPESVILLPYASIALLGIFFFSIMQRYLEAIQNAEQLNVSLEQRLMARSRELEDSHRKLRVIEQEQAVTAERQRLMREMHDGVGSSLMSSLVMVERGKLTSNEVANVLRESIDDLKLTIDSLEPMGDDLLTLLGTLRYRLGRRLEAAGIKLEWQVQETPPLAWMNPTASLQILRILQEALTNTLKHARATHIRVETYLNGTNVIIRLTDNGVGFDVNLALQTNNGRGLLNQQRRATTLDGTIEIDSRPGQTLVTLTLPRERNIVIAQ